LLPVFACARRFFEATWRYDFCGCIAPGGKYAPVLVPHLAPAGCCTDKLAPRPWAFTLFPDPSQAEEIMLKKITLISVATMLFAGCASVPMEDKASSDQAKLFNPPSEGKAGIYVYRGGGPGVALKKDIWIDGKCLGESAPNVFFFEEVEGDQEHIISTESEFSPNNLNLLTASNQNYFIRQYIKLGVFVGGANLEVMDESEGKIQVQKLEMAKKGRCSE
jgi:hypothetical protein